jgi:hypothetical protein
MRTICGAAFLHRHRLGAIIGLAHNAKLRSTLEDRLDSIAH